MDLILHLGLHKTASTSFQSICSQNRQTLAKYNIYYPHSPDEHVSHNALATLDWTGSRKLEDSVSEIVKQAPLGTKKIILSSERLQGILVDPQLRSNVLDAVRGQGFRKINFVIVYREALQYFESLYAELGKIGHTTSRFEMANKIIETGCYSYVNKNYHWRFSFQPIPAAKKLRETRVGTVSLIPFQKFLKPFPGSIVFDNQRLIDDLQNVIKQKETIFQINKRLSGRAVEFLYICNFLGIKPSQASYKKQKNLFDTLIDERLRSKAQFYQSDNLLHKIRKLYGNPPHL